MSTFGPAPTNKAGYRTVNERGWVRPYGSKVKDNVKDCLQDVGDPNKYLITLEDLKEKEKDEQGKDKYNYAKERQITYNPRGFDNPNDDHIMKVKRVIGPMQIECTSDGHIDWAVDRATAPRWR